MQRTLLLKSVFTLVILILSSNCQAPMCNINNDILICSVKNTSSLVDTSFNSSNGYSSVKIRYNGNVQLNLIAPSMKPIIIEPSDESDSHTLQISTINTAASRIDIQIRLSSNQVLLPLFTATCNITAPRSTLRISVIQSIMDPKDFKIFDDTSTSLTMNFANYELIFTRSDTYRGTLYLHNLIRLFTNITNITISGNDHDLIVNDTRMPLFIKTDRLSFKYLHLYDRMLDNFPTLKEFFIEGCRYNKTAQFLRSSNVYNISVDMRYNIPDDSSLPNHPETFKDLQRLISLTLIEQKLNSSCLRAIKQQRKLSNLLLDLGSYSNSDFDDWMQDMPIVKYLTINNISDLNIFPSKFFNKLHAIEQIILKGRFNLKKEDICIFTRINIQTYPKTPIIELNNEDKSKDDICANIYIQAINQITIEGIKCPPQDTCSDCERWANQAQQCDLTPYEETCRGETTDPGNIFFYNESRLYGFFQNRSWLNRPTNSTKSPTGQAGSVNIGAIIGATCGLLVAIVILATTIYCIYRSRQKDAAKNTSSMQEGKYRRSSKDSAHVSIATSKSSKSSRYALEKSFFPSIQPNDEIAPPLYTAPSESVGSVSAYRLPPVPSAPRESVLTHTTHVYETVDT
ncbi:unnamed protein product [Rotaria sordida]|uniref:Uncharacterized protein n=1 Tax=Rotaria sordida TaxID=392033 RepID=A0A814W4G3_9BILA|nr:unnamed protein product [Rotaria sordida]